MEGEVLFTNLKIWNSLISILRNVVSPEHERKKGTLKEEQENTNSGSLRLTHFLAINGNKIFS